MLDRLLLNDMICIFMFDGGVFDVLLLLLLLLLYVVSSVSVVLVIVICVVCSMCCWVWEGVCCCVCIV